MVATTRNSLKENNAYLIKVHSQFFLGGVVYALAKCYTLVKSTRLQKLTLWMCGDHNWRPI